MVDQVLYLNRNQSSPMYSKFKATIDESKQGKAAPALWISMIKALTSKGVKQMEINESNIIDWIETQNPSIQITKGALSKQIDSMMFTIKEVLLQNPKFKGWHQTGGNYKEYLYIANSERDNINDDIELVEYKMEELMFTPERLCDEPELIINLERERENLINQKGMAIDFTQHHFSGDTTGKHGKNLLAHCRVTERPDVGLYFIEEIQSDWAQKGRRNDWKSIPKGPLVTSTEAWAGMVLRRHMQMAAMNPDMKHFAMITESMRNGGKQNLASEKLKFEQKQLFDAAVKEKLEEKIISMSLNSLPPDAQKEAKAMALESAKKEVESSGIHEPNDMLNDFYLKVLPKMMDKILSGTGEKVQIKRMELAPGVFAEIPTIEITDKVREKLIEKQPVYSRALLLKEFNPIEHDNTKLTELVKSAADMIGSVKHLRLVKNLFDISTGAKVAGRYVNKLIQVSMFSKNIEEVMDHECMHFAQENLLSRKENAILEKAFATGSQLNEDVRKVLISRGDFAMAQECIKPSESIAQGFALWKNGKLDVQEKPVRGIFSDLISVVKDTVQWIKKEVLLEKYQTVEDVFEGFANGDIAKRHQNVEESFERMRILN